MKHGPLSSEWRNVPEYYRRVKTGIYLALTILVLGVAPTFSQLFPAARGKIADDNKADVRSREEFRRVHERRVNVDRR